MWFCGLHSTGLSVVGSEGEQARHQEASSWEADALQVVSSLCQEGSSGDLRSGLGRLVKKSAEQAGAPGPSQ